MVLCELSMKKTQSRGWQEGSAKLEFWRMNINWIENAEGLVAEFKFPAFMKAIDFIVALAAEAERADHHPDVDLRWNRVKVRWITHDGGARVTERDRALAEVTGKIAAEFSAVAVASATAQGSS
jgi:4a-hydroxytetrahydrobiopterin dehydratase